MALINYVTRVQFGFGELATLKAELELAGISRPMIVTDKGGPPARISRQDRSGSGCSTGGCL